MNATMAATLIDANQNSNSPYERVESKIRRRQQHHQHEADLPDRQRDPSLQDGGACDRLDADDDHPEVPIEPAADEAGPAARGPRARDP